jgi:hypothetical protein
MPKKFMFVLTEEVIGWNMQLLSSQKFSCFEFGIFHFVVKLSGFSFQKTGCGATWTIENKCETLPLSKNSRF